MHLDSGKERKDMVVGWQPAFVLNRKRTSPLQPAWPQIWPPSLPNVWGLLACIIQQDLISTSGSPPFNMVVTPVAEAHKGAHPVCSGLGAPYECTEYLISKYRLFQENGGHFMFSVNLPISLLCSLPATEEKQGHTEG